MGAKRTPCIDTEAPESEAGSSPPPWFGGSRATQARGDVSKLPRKDSWTPGHGSWSDPQPAGPFIAFQCNVSCALLRVCIRFGRPAAGASASRPAAGAASHPANRHVGKFNPLVFGNRSGSPRLTLSLAAMSGISLWVTVSVARTARGLSVLLLIRE